MMSRVLFWIFQFSPSREGGHSPYDRTKWYALFQFSPSREGGQAKWKNGKAKITFQFSPSREGGRQNCAEAVTWSRFQFSPSREGGLSMRVLKSLISCYFNSRPRVRAVAQRDDAASLAVISILALA